MTSTLRPDDIQQLAEAINWAVGDKTTLAITGHMTKAKMGRASPADMRLDMTAFSGVTLYEPEELVMSAKAATPRSEIEQLLASKNQQLAFEPPDLSALLGSDNAGTLGGMVAINFAGPRRFKAGAVRDAILGFEAVSGRGDIFKSGGRVMKNVTGYDLSKLMAGSWGTLAAFSDITLKVLPQAETEQTLVIAGLDDDKANATMTIAMRGDFDISGCAHLPAEIVRRSRVREIGGAGKSLTVMRLEGFAPSVEKRLKHLRKAVNQLGVDYVVPQDSSRALWKEIRNVGYLSRDHSRLVWRLSVPASDGAMVMRHIKAHADVSWFYDWAGGLIWLEIPESPHAEAEIIRGAIAATSGHAMLVRAPETLRAALPVFEPLSPALATLGQRIKTAFDPLDILNPGRMYPQSANKE